MRALVVEDEVGVASFIEGCLREASIAVDVAADGQAGIQLGRENAYDVIVLDLMLPIRDGFSVVRALRAEGVKAPVICLTARDAVDDRVKGLDSGADDYMVKPFSPAELLARIRALVRRTSAIATNPIRVGDLVIDVVARHVERAGRRIDLSAREFALLEYLARNVGHVLTRYMILEKVWDMNQDPLTNVVDVQMTRLRKKIDHGYATPLIHTVRGVGFVLRAD
ncbi:MAG: response regulator transcription factor [Planctomycetes bacterium]|nr:response regulator transcription factor [Planctomycetota bacterium]